MDGHWLLLAVPLKQMGPNANFWVLCGDSVLAKHGVVSLKEAKGRC